MTSHTYRPRYPSRTLVQASFALRCLSLALLSISLTSVAFGQTVTSTAAGGDWNAADTWVEGSVPDETNDVVIEGFVHVTTGARCRDLTINPAGALQNASSFRTLAVHGDVINDGTTLDNPAGGELTLDIAGNVTNNGTWQHASTRMIGSGDQLLSLAQGRSFASDFSKRDSVGVLRAATDLYFVRVVDLWMGPVLDMQGRALRLGGEANILDGKAVNVGDLVLMDGAVLRGTTLQGDMRLKGLVQVNIDVRLEGTITVLDTLQNISGGLNLTVDGDLVNRGVVRDNPENGSLNISTYGDVVNEGIWTTRRVYLDGIGQRTIDARGVVSEIRSRGEGVVLAGPNYIPELILDGGSSTRLAAGASLTVDDWIRWSVFGEGLLHNFGTLVENRLISGEDDSYLFHHLKAGISASQGFDALRVTTYGHKAPETFANAVRKWWKLESSPASETALIPWVAFDYDPEELAGQVESQLEVFYSDDDGQTWHQISTPENMSRLLSSHSIRLTDVPSTGAFALSSNTEMVSALVSVIPSIIGRDQIRLGPPNRYTIHYFNNSDVSTGDMLLRLTTGGGVHIEALELETPDGTFETVPVDSLTFDGVDTEVYLWVTDMAPDEARSFDVIARAYPEDTGKSSGAAAGSGATANLGEMVVGLWNGRTGPNVPKAITDFTTHFTRDIWGQLAACESVSESLFGAFLSAAGKTGKGFFFGSREGSMKKLAGSTITNMAKHANPVLAGLYSKGKDAHKIYDSAGSAFEAAIQYKYGGLIVPDCHGNLGALFGGVAEVSKQMEPVSSMDPNAKAGPGGYGEPGFISSAGRIPYQIFFENLATATAPAWRIVVVDTLADVFDPETVEFGTTSHEGEQYEWQITRDGSILRWEIEGIELVPNVNPPEGEGYVTFSVVTRPELPSGTVLRNRAEIVFDFNAPILTDEVLNTLDFDPPVTTMLPLAQDVRGPQLVVRWSGDDGPSGSGVESRALFASRNGGAFEHVGTTDQDSLVVDVESGGAYSFYALARDHVGNVERERPAVVETSVVVDVEEMDTRPYAFKLNQNYPNPFNPSTHIEFSVAVSGKTTLTVYNVLGQEISTIINERLEPGNYDVQWDATHVSSGVYFYRLTQGDNTSIRQMILVR